MISPSYLLIMLTNLVGGLEHEFYFSIYFGIIIPTDFHIFQRGRSTTNQIIYDEKQRPFGSSVS